MMVRGFIPLWLLLALAPRGRSPVLAEIRADLNWGLFFRVGIKVDH